jgi:hypothetical protein
MNAVYRRGFAAPEDVVGHQNRRRDANKFLTIIKSDQNNAETAGAIEHRFRQ